MHKRTYPRIVVTLPPDIVDMIDEYRWTNRIESRSATIAHLVRIGLSVADATGTATAPAGDRDSRRD